MTPIDSLFSHRRRRRYPSNNQSQPSTHTNRWKEDLRRACLERARQSRLDLVRRKRGQLPTQSDNEEELSPLMMVMEECQNQKVGVNTSTNTFNTVNRDDNQNFGAMELDKTLLDSGDHTLTEDDLFEILREVEEELRLDEEIFLEEVLKAEDDFIEDTVADYEHWQETKKCDEQIPCPICQTSKLAIDSLRAEIYCTDEFCPFRKRAEMVQAPLAFFRDQLSRIHEIHSDKCSSPIRFQIRSASNGGCILMVICEACNLSYEVE